MPAAACFALAACVPLAAGTNLALVLVAVVEAVEPVTGVMPPMAAADASVAGHSERRWPPLRLQWQQELQP